MGSVYTIKSIVVTNRDSSPPVISNPEVRKGLLKAVVGEAVTNQLGNSDIGAAGTAIKLVSIPSNARLHSLDYEMGVLGTSSLYVAAFYPTVIPQGGFNAPASTLAGTLISSSTFVGNLSGADTSLGWTDCFGTSVALGVRQKPLWSLLGLTVDPGVDLDLGFSVKTAVTSNGYVGLKATYVD